MSGIRLWVIGWLSFSASLGAQEKVKLLPGPFEFPAEVGPLKYDGKPHKFDDAGAGIAYPYSADGYTLTVYVYDAGLKEIPEGAGSLPVCLQMQEAIQGVRRSPSYSKVTLIKENFVHLHPEDVRPMAREVEFELEYQGHTLKSFAWLTAAAGHFVKFRMTASPERAPAEIVSARRLMLYAMASIVRPHLAPLAAKPEPAAAAPAKKGPSIQIGFSGNDVDLEASIVYLGALSALAEDHAERAPTCGGPYEPTFAEELGAWQLTLTTLESGRGGSRDLKTLFEADKAGFLEEVVWTGMHLDAWGTTPPEGLTLDTFAPWSKKKLKNFARPIQGSLTFEQPRDLPTEPAPAPPTP